MGLGMVLLSFSLFHFSVSFCSGRATTITKGKSPCYFFKQAEGWTHPLVKCPQKGRSRPETGRVSVSWTREQFRGLESVEVSDDEVSPDGEQHASKRCQLSPQKD